MRIREHAQIEVSSKADRQQIVLEAIMELEQQHADGEMETPAYLIKKRALVKML